VNVKLAQTIIEFLMIKENAQLYLAQEIQSLLSMVTASHARTTLALTLRKENAFLLNAWKMKS